MPVVGPVVAHSLNICWGPINLACSAAKGAATGAASAAETSMLDVVASAITDAAKAVIDGMVQALNATTTVDFSAPWFAQQAKTMAVIAVPFVLAFFLFQIIGAVLRREPGGLARAGVGIGKALVAGAAAIPILQIVLVACDQMCDLLIGTTGGGIAGLVQSLLVASLTNPTGGAALVGILGCWAIAACFVLWAVLLFRKALLLVTGAFTFFAFAGASWDATRSWVRKWVETVAALVFSKLVIVVILVTGIHAMGSSSTAGSGEASGATLSDVFAGLLLVSIATLAPWLCWKFVHWSGAELAHDMHQTMARSPIPAGARKAGQVAKVAAAGVVAGPPGAAAAAATNGLSPSTAAGNGVPRPPASPPGGGSTSGSPPAGTGGRGRTPAHSGGTP
jgi:hypothetical protein